jgi:replicative DNA helicase
MTTTSELIPRLILQKLVSNEDYMRKSIPYLKKEYFEEDSEKLIFDTINEFINSYNKLPPKKAILIELAKNQSIQKNQQLVEDTIEIITEMYQKESSSDDLTWLLKTTETWCQERAIYNAIVASINILDGKDKVLTKHAIPELLKDSLAVSFDTHIGHDYLENFDERYAYYHSQAAKLPFDIDLLNTITNGGVEDKTFNVILGAPGSGKTLILCHFASSYLLQSKNVLYITLEMAEEKIAQRIDSNIMNVALNDLKNLPESIFNDRIDSITKKTKGRLIVKEYPTSTAHAGHFRALLNELKIKKDFTPDVILIDYINICASSRLRMGGSVNSYTYIKAISEELRGLAVEFKVPIWSATQTNRDGSVASDLDMTNTSESMGLPHTVDLLLGVISTEELQQRGQYLFKQLGKNRYGDVSFWNKFYVGVSKSKMKLYDVDNSKTNSNSSSNSEKNHTDELIDSSLEIDDKNNDDFSDFTF